MAIGMPAHLRPRNTATAFARAAHTIAIVCIVADALAVGSLQAAYPDFPVWPAFLALLPMLAALVVLDRLRTVPFAVLYLAVGGLCTYWFALTVLTAYPMPPESDAFGLTLLRVALALVGGIGAAALSGLAWCLAGILVAETAISAAAITAGDPIAFDPAAILVLAIVAATFAGTAWVQRGVRQTQPRLHRAANDETLAATRFLIESRAAAVMHDTVLGHLAAIATLDAGPLRPELRAQIERDLEVIVGEEWLAAPPRGVDAVGPDGSRQGILVRAIEEVRAQGLLVDLSGDLSAGARLDPAQAEAVALAVKQCLVNVLKHSGADYAEVIVYGSESDVSVMVVDEGRGFDEARVSPDRLGLRQSVRRRVEDAGGTVQVWSAPGRGTSVMIRVPVPASRPQAVR